MSTIAVVDNNIIDRLLILKEGAVKRLNEKIIFQTHYNIFDETNACSDEEKRQKLLQIYPKFEIKIINDNSLPMRFPATLYSNEAWDMQKLFMINKSPTTAKSLKNMRNDSLLILMQRGNQLSDRESILISDNKNDFQNFCRKNAINWCDWNSFEKRIEEF